MMMQNKQETFVLDLGGSVFAPNGHKREINIKYLNKFEKFIRKQIAEKNRRFFIITGGGYIARQYRDAGAAAAGREDITDDDLDWLGVHATRLNAHLLRTIFRDVAYPWILKHYDMVDKKAIEYPVVVCGGWKPGWSTDYCAALVAVDYEVDTVINMSNIEKVYDKDPNQYKDAKPIETMSWDELISIVGNKWKPGLNTPFDPMASKLGKEAKLKVVVCNGRDLSNLEKILDGEKFVGTVIG